MEGSGHPWLPRGHRMGRTANLVVTQPMIHPGAHSES